jgi:hypothetical protein
MLLAWQVMLASGQVAAYLRSRVAIASTLSIPSGASTAGLSHIVHSMEEAMFLGSINSIVSATTQLYNDSNSREKPHRTKSIWRRRVLVFSRQSSEYLQ